MNDLTLVNVSLAVLAAVSLLEFLIILGAGFYGYRMYRQAMAVVESVERVHLAPIRARVDAVLDEVQEITTGMKHAQESVSHAIEVVAETGGAVAGVVRSRMWPVIGVIKGIRAIAGHY